MNKLRIICTLFVLMLCNLGCIQEREIPNLSKETLIKVIVDLHIAQEMTSKFRESERDSVRQLFYYEIGQIHDLDTARITSELEILQSNPKFAFEVYSEVYSYIDGMSNKNENK